MDNGQCSNDCQFVSETMNVSKEVLMAEKPQIFKNIFQAEVLSKSSKDSERSENSRNAEEDIKAEDNGAEFQFTKQTSYKNKIHISKGKRIGLYVLLNLINLISNYDHGTIPAVVSELEKQYKLGLDKIGLFGSLVFIGLAIGALFLSKFVNKVNTKVMLAFSIFFVGVLVSCFPISDNVLYLSANRLTTGFFQALISIYIPVWIDQFGLRSSKTIMITLFQITSPLGLIVGYLATDFIKKYIHVRYNQLLLFSGNSVLLYKPLFALSCSLEFFYFLHIFLISDMVGYVL